MPWQAQRNESIFDRVDSLNVWKRGSQRAPHKPILLLIALGRASRGDSSPVLFEEIAPKIEELLREFGPSRQSYHPEYPFWRLQNDGLWSVASDTALRARESNSDPPKSELIAKHATGQLSPDVLEALERDSTAAARIARKVLESHFPQTLHDDILNSVGLDLAPQSPRRRRNPRFREQVLRAYEYRCAVCGMDIRICNVTVGLEAAHIEWHQAGGPDSAQNGLALCSTHHKTFDLGVFTIDPTEGLLVSELVTGSTEFDHMLLRHHGKPVRPPQHTEQQPDPIHLEWHRRQVFKEGPRHILSR